MGAGAYIGRVGALAVALGVGVAVATGQGVAWADDATNSSGSSSQESGSRSSNDTSSNDTSSNDTAPNDTSPDHTTQPSTDTDDPDETDTDTDEDSEVTDPDEDTEEPAAAEPTEEPSADPEIPDEPDSTPVDVPADDTPAVHVPDVDNPDVDNPDVDNPDVDNPDVEPSDDHQRRALIDTQQAGETERVVEVTAPSLESAVESEPVDTDAAAVAVETLQAAPAASRATTLGALAPESKVAAPPTVTTPMTILSGLLAAVGVSPLVGTSPVSPAPTGALWAVLAWARREFERAVATLEGRTAPTAAVTTSQISTAAVAPGAIVYVPDLRAYSQVRGWVTGPNTVTVDPKNNTPGNFDIYGTDLGIMWDNGLSGAQNQVLMAFGDTFSQPGMQGNWRSNVLFRSGDTNLDNGLDVAPGSTSDIFAGSPLSGPGNSAQLVDGIPGTIGLFGIPGFFGSEVTMIPTAGVSVPTDTGSRQYMNVMSVRQWGPSGMWTTNYSAIAYSDNNGQTWTLDPDTIRSAGYLRTNGHAYVEGNDNFQQGAFVRGVQVGSDGLAVRDANGDVVHDGYVYSYGTPSGRFGNAYLSRVAEDDVLELDSYEYWNGSSWSDSPGDAVPVIPPNASSPFAGLISLANNIIGLFGIPITIPTGDVGEISVQYNEYLDEYIMLYTDGSGRVVMRTSNTPEGLWSDTTVLADSTRFPGLYAPMIHPWSGTDKISGGDQYLYWNLSQWNQYNVEFIKTDLSPMKGL